MKIIIKYKTSFQDDFEEKDLDCTKLTIRGHAAKMIDAWVTEKDIYTIDNYNCILFSEVISIRVL